MDINSIVSIKKFNTAQQSVPYLIKLLYLKLDNVPMNMKIIETKIKQRQKSIAIYPAAKCCNKPIIEKLPQRERKTLMAFTPKAIGSNHLLNLYSLFKENKKTRHKTGVINGIMSIIMELIIYLKFWANGNHKSIFKISITV